MSRISLLTKNGNALPLLTTAEKEAGKALLKDLQLDKVLWLLCPEAAPRQALTDALCRSAVQPEDIRFRGQVQALFAAHPTLLEDLLGISLRLGQTKNAWDADRSRLLSGRRTNPSDIQLQLSVSRDVLGLTCMYLRSFISQIRELSQVLAAYPDSAKVLAVFRENCDRVWRGQTELVEFADRCHRMLNQATRYRLEVMLDPTLYTHGYILQDFTYLRQNGGKPGSRDTQKDKGSLLSLLGRKSKDNGEKRTVGVPTETGKPLSHPMDITRQMELTQAAVAECDRYLTAMLRGLLDRFSQLEDELYFYTGALQIRQALLEKGVPAIYPTITPSSTGTITITGLYDLLLLSGTTKDRVVPNDVVLSCEAQGLTTQGKHRLPGMLIHGENNSGKTVFLRSVGTAILFAQCGLPIPATDGTISIRKRLYTQFATAEGKLVSGSTAGRFEEEAAALARMLDDMEPDSLFLLNETFQTTAYGEGAAGIAPILRYIGDCGGAFVFVTHLTALLSTMEEQVVIAKTSDRPETKYKVFIEK